MKKKKEIWLFSPKFLCPKRNKPFVFYWPIVVLYLLYRHLASPQLSSFAFPATIASFPLYFTSYLNLLISFHGTRQDLGHSRPATTIITNSMIGYSWVKLRVIGVKCALTQRSNLASTTPMTVKTQPISWSKSEVFLFIALIILVIAIFSWRETSWSNVGK